MQTTAKPLRCRYCSNPIELHPAPHTYGWVHATNQKLWCASGRSMARPDIDTIAAMRLSDMPAFLASAIENTMRADGYLTRYTYNPFSDLDPAYEWLRKDYTQDALQSLTEVAGV